MRNPARPITVEGNAAIHVYRVLQEALNNIARHAGAREAWVRLRFLPEELELEVEDQGRGFRRNRSAQAREWAWWPCVSARSYLGGTIALLASARWDTGASDSSAGES